MHVSEDPAVGAVLAAIRAVDLDGSRTARVLRSTIDQLYDGQRTGRYRWDQLLKTEKAHCGTLVEINVQREFEFADGERMDFRIAGHEVDCKYSQSDGGWMVPLEAIDEILLVLTASDANSTWSMGVVRASPDRLRGGGNRDSKVGLTAEGRTHIRWLRRNEQLKPNTLLHLPPSLVDEILQQRSGLARLVMLFRRCLDTVLSRNVIVTVGHGLDDPLRRVRSGSSGARGQLESEGILILGGQEAEDLATAERLGLPRIEKGEFIATRRHLHPLPPE